MWILYALLAGMFFTVNGLFARKLLRGKQDSWAFSLCFSLIGAVVTLPFMLADPKIPRTAEPWALAVLCGFLIVGHNYCLFKASNTLEASVVGAVSKIRLAWVFVLSIALMHTPFSWLTLTGVGLAIAASVVTARHIERLKPGSGMTYVLVATLFYTGIILIFKQLFNDFNAVSLTFFVAFLIPAVLNFVMLPRAASRMTQMLRGRWRLIIIGCGAGALANIAQIAALGAGPTTAVLVVIEAFLVLTFVAEHLFMGETRHLKAKMAAVLLATSGAILICFGPQ